MQQFKTHQLLGEQKALQKYLQQALLGRKPAPALSLFIEQGACRLQRKEGIQLVLLACSSGQDVRASSAWWLP